MYVHRLVSMRARLRTLDRYSPFAVQSVLARMHENMTPNCVLGALGADTMVRIMAVIVQMRTPTGSIYRSSLSWYRRIV